jgi:hypothetical protein
MPVGACFETTNRAESVFHVGAHVGGFEDIDSVM